MLTFGELDPSRYLLLLAVLLAIGLVLIGRKNIWGILDPLNLVLIGVSFNVANVIYFAGDNTADAIYFSIGFLLFCLSLRLGMYFGARSTDLKFAVKALNLQQNATPREARFYFGLAILLQALYLAFLLSRAGFGLITGEVSPDVKTMIFLDGGGIFKYVLWASNLVFLPAIYYLWVTSAFKKLVIVGIVWFIVTNLAFGTSKIGFILIIFDIFLLSRYFRVRLYKTEISRTFLVSAATLGLIPAFVVLTFYANVREVSIIEFLVERLIDTGGGSFAYFVLGAKQAFVDLTLIDRLGYYFDTVLSVLRLKEWADPNVAASITQYLTGGYQIGYGQNPYLFLNGHFLFGYWGGPVYVAALGFCFGIVRSATYANVFLYFFLNRFFAFAIADPDMSQALFVSSLLIIAIVWSRAVLMRVGEKRNPARA